jgi:hypothetical protein
MALLGHATRTGLAEVVIQRTAGAGYIGINTLGSAGVTEKSSTNEKRPYLVLVLRETALGSQALELLTETLNSAHGTSGGQVLTSRACMGQSGQLVYQRRFHGHNSLTALKTRLRLIP